MSVAPRFRRAALCGSAMWLCSISSLEAQVVTDGTVGAPVTLGGPNITIGADLGSIRGANLFHSFARFGVETGGSVTFTGPGGLSNVVGRVTGGEASSIDGLLRSTVPGADLWLLNPAGILFGPGARLDVPGSFHASTTGELRFADGAVFSALDPAGSVLSVAAPESFGFLGGDTRSITVDRSRLSVGEGETLALVGGDVTVTASGAGVASLDPDASLVEDLIVLDADPSTITFGGMIDFSTGRPVHFGGTPVISGSELFADGIVHAPGGTVRLVAQGSRGIVDVGTGEADIAATGSLLVTDQAMISSSGDGGGSIDLRGGEVEISRQSFVTSLNSGTTDATGGTRITAGSLTIDESILDTQSFAGGRAADIDISATGLLELRRGGRIDSFVRQDGDAGHIRIAAEEVALRPRDRDARLAGAAIQTVVRNFATGNAGDLRVTTGDLTIGNLGTLFASTFGDGDAGDIFVDVARRLSIRSGSGTTGIQTIAGPGEGDARFTGDAGSIFIRAGEFVMEGGPRVRAVTQTRGQGGSIRIEAESLRLSQPDPPARGGATVIESSSVQRRQSDGFVDERGNAGSIFIDVENDLVMEGKTAIRSDALGGGPANAGSVTIRAGSMVIDDLEIGDNVQDSRGIRTVVSSNPGDPLATGQGGEIDIDVAGPITMRGARIEAFTSGDGDAGDITIRADSLDLLRDGIISAATFGNGDAGSITFDIDGRLRVEGVFSQITGLNQDSGIIASTNPRPTGEPPPEEGAPEPADATVTGDAGTITITAGSVELEGSGRIQTLTQTRGNAGQITIRADALRLRQLEPPRRGGAAVIESASASDRTGTAPDRGDAGIIDIDVEGAIEILGKAEIRSEARGGGVGSAGNVTMRAGSLTIDPSDVPEDNLQTVSGIGADVFSNRNEPLATGNGGTLDITVAGDLFLRGGSIKADTVGEGDAGDVTVRADNVEIRDGGRIGSSTQGNGNAGSVTLDVARRLFMQAGGNGGGTGIQAEALATARRGGRLVGDAGSIVIDAGEIEMQGAPRIRAVTQTGGDAGSITIRAGRLIMSQPRPPRRGGAAIIESTSERVTDDLGQPRGNAGSIDIEVAGAIELVGKAEIRSQSRDGGEGDAGSVDIRARSLLINTLGIGRNLQTVGGIRADTASGRDDPPHTGQGGSVTVDVDRIVIDGGRIAASTGGDGDGGDVVINAGRFVISGDGTNLGLIASSSNARASSGDAGDVRITAGSLVLGKMGLITSSTNSAGDAGNITISGERVTLREGKVLTSVDPTVAASDGAAQRGGSITVTGSRRVDLVRTDVSSSGVVPGEGASTITVTAPLVVVNGSRVQSLVADLDVDPTAVVPVDTGRITVAGDNAVISGDSVLQASNQIAIDADQSDLGSDVSLPENIMVGTDELLADGCAVASDEAGSTFVSVGRGGFPAAPDRPLGSAHAGIQATGLASSKPCPDELVR